MALFNPLLKYLIYYETGHIGWKVVAFFVVVINRSILVIALSSVWLGNCVIYYVHFQTESTVKET